MADKSAIFSAADTESGGRREFPFHPKRQADTRVVLLCGQTSMVFAAHPTGAAGARVVVRAHDRRRILAHSPRRVSSDWIVNVGA
jgi:hypothetical protein